MIDTGVEVTVWEHVSGSLWADVGSVDAWSDLSVERRHLQPGPWSLTLPLSADALRFTEPDAKRYLLTFAARGEESTGLIEHVSPSQPETGGISLELGGMDAMALLGDPTCWPVPASSLASQSTAYYKASGTCETVCANLIAAQMNRLYAGGVYQLTIPTSQGRGAAVSVNERFTNLLEVVTRKCGTANLGVRVGLKRQAPSSTRANLTVEFYVPRDLSGEVFLSQDTGTVRSWSQSDDIPTITRVIEAGSGKGTARIFRPVSDASAEADWGRRRESYVDARDTSSTTELDSRGKEDLLNAAGQSSFDLQALDAEGMHYGDHFTLGDSLTVELGMGITKVDRLNGIVLSSGETGAVQVQLRPGNPDVEPLFKQAQVIRNMAQQIRQLQQQEQ